MDWVQLSQGYRAITRRQFVFLPLSPQEFLVPHFLALVVPQTLTCAPVSAVKVSCMTMWTLKLFLLFNRDHSFGFMDPDVLMQNTEIW